MFGVEGMEDSSSISTKQLPRKEKRQKFTLLQNVDHKAQVKNGQERKQTKKTHQVICDNWKGKVQPSAEIKKKVIEKFREKT